MRETMEEEFVPVFRKIPKRFVGAHKDKYDRIEMKIKSNPDEPLMVDRVNTWKDRNRWASAARYRKWGFAQRLTRDENGLKCWDIWVWWTPRFHEEET